MGKDEHVSRSDLNNLEKSLNTKIEESNKQLMQAIVQLKDEMNLKSQTDQNLKDRVHDGTPAVIFSALTRSYQHENGVNFSVTQGKALFMFPIP